MPGSQPVVQAADNRARAPTTPTTTTSRRASALRGRRTTLGLPRHADGDEGDFVIRGGYTRAFSRGGLNDFTASSTPTPASSSVQREEGQRQPRRRRRCCCATPRRLGPPAFASTPVYPMTDVVTQDIQRVRPEHRGAVRRSFSLACSAASATNMALEVRYVGTRGKE